MLISQDALMGPHVSEGGRCANKTVERKALIQCTFSPDDPKTSMELKLLGGNKMAKRGFCIRSLFSEFLLLSK